MTYLSVEVQPVSQVNESLVQDSDWVSVLLLDWRCQS